jgi:hypothetical protein
MRNWDLTTAAAKLEAAQKTFQVVQVDTAEQWNDEIRRNFHERLKLIPTFPYCCGSFPSEPRRV